jgi:protein-S-isoprenylcysteine O-methyltransferase Ste14
MNDLLQGFFAPWAIYAILLALHVLLPARRIAGYVRDPRTDEPLGYRLNGPLVLLCAVVLWALAGWFGFFPWDWLYYHRWSGLVGSCVLGLIFSLAMVMPAQSSSRPFLADLYLGRWENPQFSNGRVDAKMFLYLVGATMLTLNVLSFLAHHMIVFGAQSSPGVFVYCCLFLWFVVDYLVFERVHLYTYDLFAERVGFKLGWGCLTFYPYFYCIGLWAAADLPDPHTAPALLVAFAAVFFAGWILSRGANLQKYFFKTNPERALLGLIKPQTISDGKSALLCNGFWGVSRHVNYLGEILMAIGLTLVLGWPAVWAAWLYPIYYVVLLFPRERADERRCAVKYGALWDEYVKRVPNRIIPGLY